MKFAYLIMAHNNPEQLKILLKLLDHKENDIYLHIDKRNHDISVPDIVKCVKSASLHVYRKYKIYHAGYSQTICQSYLLEEACKTYHDYYHLISNSDLPLKSHARILHFFEENKGKEFIHFEGKDYTEKDICKYYLFLYFPVCKTHGMVKRFLIRLENKNISIQQKIGIHRKFYCGANWYSITHLLAKDFCAHKRDLLRRVRWTISSDEIIMQTFFRDITKNHYSLYSQTASDYDYSSLNRAIDWYRGTPYVWKARDYEELINSPAVFGRKFDITVDEKIVQEIADYVSGNGKQTYLERKTE